MCRLRRQIVDYILEIELVSLSRWMAEWSRAPPLSSSRGRWRRFGPHQGLIRFLTYFWGYVKWPLQNPWDIFSNLMSDPLKNSSGRVARICSEKIFHIKRKTKNPSDVVAKNNTKKNVCSNIHQTTVKLWAAKTILLCCSFCYHLRVSI